MKHTIALLMMAISFSSCGIIDMRTERGNGRIQTENRPEKDFQGIHSYGSFDVYVTTDSSYSVKIEAEENLLRFIETAVENGVLKIGTRSGVSIDPGKDMKVYVSAPAFRELSSSGSGNIIGQNTIVSDDHLDLNISGSGDVRAAVKTGTVSADISGSGNVTLSGEAKNFKTTLAGNGDIKAQDLKTEESSVNIAGSGNAVVNASKRLEVHIAGSGDVKYIGNPEISQEVAGSGNIEKVQ